MNLKRLVFNVYQDRYEAKEDNHNHILRLRG